ncbi:MAG: hypothetical protein J7M18_00045, partial [Candidatus Eremiobacteraeota bacterium]|nr:hypothetical protein [Candidatus Eremiobacteraeota bacterium]
MKKLITIFIFLILLVIPISISGEPAEIMPVSEIRPGMKGYGLSVFKGTKIEKFPITVLGVLENFVADGEIILFRIEGGYCVDHRIGVIAGMSGSPVYINGKLIGAIAYGWGFTHEAIGGITPIENMLQYLPGNKARTTKNTISHSAKKLQKPIVIGKQKFTSIKIGRIDEKPDPESGTMVLYPCASYLQVSGFSDRVFNEIKKNFKKNNLICIQSGGGGTFLKDVPSPSLVPGAAVSLQLVSGDFSMYGTGTLTYRDGKHVLAFGHPFMNCGDLNFPMTTSYIHDVIPSIYHPFKLSSPIKVIGVISSDRLHAVKGEIWKQGNAFPGIINLKDHKNNQEFHYKIKVSQHSNFAPNLFGYSLWDAMDNLSLHMSENTSRIKYKINIPGYRTVTFEDLVTGNNVGFASFIQCSDYLSMLSENHFDPARFASVSVDVDVTPGKSAYRVERIFTDSPTCEPGEPIHLSVLLSRYGGGSEVHNFTIPVPVDLGEGEIRIGVCGGMEAEIFAKSIGLKAPGITNLRQLLYYMEEKEKNYQLVVKAIYPRGGLRIGGMNLPLMPSALVKAFLAGPDSETSHVQDHITLRKDLDGLIQGSKSMSITIESPPQPSEGKEPGPSQPVKGHEEEIRFAWDKLQNFHNNTGMNGDLEFEESVGEYPVQEKESVEELPEHDTLTWTWNTMADFEPGEFENIQLSSTGELSIGPKINTMFSSDDGMVWAIIPDNTTGGVFASMGTGGNIFRISPEGEILKTYSVPDLIVTSLCQDSNGNIIAGTTPRGRVYRIQVDGNEKEMIYDSQSTYVWDLLPGDDGEVIIALGNPANIIRLRRGIYSETIFSPPCIHASSLARVSDEVIIVGCASPGIVYQVKKGLCLPIITLSGDCEAVTVSRDQSVWASSGNYIYHILPDGKIRKHYLKYGPFPGLISSPDGYIYAGGGKHGHIFKIGPDNKVYIISRTGSAQVTRLAMLNDKVVAGASFPLKLLKLEDQAKSGTYTSQVIESDQLAQWGIWRSISEVPKGGSITLQARSGNTPSINDRWSSWSTETPVKGYSDAQLLIPQNRFIQYRLNLQRGTGESSPVFQNLSLFYRYLTQPPLIVFKSPTGNKPWAGEEEVKWALHSPGGASLKFTIEFSNDGGKTWNPVIRNVWLGPGEKGEYSYKLDTSIYRDGLYLLKVSTSCAEPSKDGSLHGEVISKPFIICN